MIRVTFELLPRGDESRARTIGQMEIANIRMHADGTADYAVAMKKTPPFAGALKAAWKTGHISSNDGILNSAISGDNDEMVTALVLGHHRTRRGVYDLLYRAMIACGLHRRNEGERA